jgi:ubiquinone/menaquinone biosynthesis C-methylase UbiE
MEYVNCNLCGANNYDLLVVGKDQLFGSEERFNIVKCKECDLIYLNPRPKETEITKYYPSQCLRINIPDFILYLKTWIAVKRDIFRLKKVVPKNGRILEIGFGNGEYLAGLRDTGGFEVTGVEISKYNVERARERFNLNVTLGTIFDANFEDNYFDLVIIRHALEHLYDPSATLIEIHRVLKKNGKLFFVVPNHDSLEVAIFKEQWSAYDAPRHTYYFSLSTLNKMLIKNHFSILKTYYYFTPTITTLSLRNFLNNKKFPKLIVNFFNIHNPFLLFFYFPISLYLCLMKQSNSIGIIAIKQDNVKLKNEK